MAELEPNPDRSAWTFLLKPLRVGLSLVAENTLGTLGAAGVVALGAVALAYFGVAVRIPAWLGIVVIASVCFLGFVAGWGLRRRHLHPAMAAQQQRLDRLREDFLRHEKYARHLVHVVSSLQLSLLGVLPNETWQRFIEGGILQPASAWLRHDDLDEIRLAVLAPTDEDPLQLAMPYAAGQFTSQARFRIDRNDSVAGLAMASGESIWMPDVEIDSRYHRHPRASGGYPYRSLGVIPLKLGDKSVGVLSVSSLKVDAFGETDRIYVRMLAVIIELALCLRARQVGDSVVEGE